MGKKLFGVIAFVAIAAVAAWNYNQNNQKVELSDLPLEDVEALARGESIDQNINTLQNQDLVARNIHTNINVVMFGQIANINSI